MGDPQPDQQEVDRAEYFTLDEILALPQVPAINLEVARRALADDRRLLNPQILSHVSGSTYTLFVG
jgi:NADH pyrophosphatase NudC (nudix superfamily)